MKTHTKHPALIITQDPTLIRTKHPAVTITQDPTLIRTKLPAVTITQDPTLIRTKLPTLIISQDPAPTRTKHPIKTHTTQHGFTLIELMIVIAIIGILVGMGIPSYKNHVRKAHYTEITQATIPYKLAIEECYQLYADLTHCTNNNLSITNYQSKNTDQLIHSITVSSGAIITVIPNNRYGITPTDTYQLTPHITDHRLSWQESGGGVDQGYT